ncbi:MAG: MBL fold metallo-hydrolase [Arcanobacterium sp.]
MIILNYDQTFIQANTYIVADDDAREALVIDTGAGSAQWIKDTLAEHQLSLGAVLLTHGHLDHIWDSAAVAGDAPVYIPAPDRYRVEDPFKSSLPDAARDLALARMGAQAWKVPSNLLDLPQEMLSGSFEIVKGVYMRALPTPGHSEGSTVFLTQGTISDESNVPVVSDGRVESSMFAGDVIFRNGIGRTDLPGGDEQEMMASLRLLVNVIRPETVIFPGHGGHTTMFYETRYSPYMHAAMSS